MGTWIKCEECEKTHRYNSDEIDNIGTIWHPIWAVTCHNCGAKITHDADFSDFINKFRISGGDFKVTLSKKGIRERAESNDIREYWIQQYVKEHYIKLGFLKIKTPFQESA